MLHRSRGDKTPQIDRPEELLRILLGLSPRLETYHKSNFVPITVGAPKNAKASTARVLPSADWTSLEESGILEAIRLRTRQIAIFWGLPGASGFGNLARQEDWRHSIPLLSGQPCIIITAFFGKLVVHWFDQAASRRRANLLRWFCLLEVVGFGLNSMHKSAKFR